MFLCVPKSLIRTKIKPKSTNKVTASQRNADVDELSRFTEKDKIARPTDVNDSEMEG